VTTQLQLINIIIVIIINSMTLEYFRQIFKKYPNTKFHENPSSGSPVIPCVHTDGQANTTKLTVAFRNFANAPKQC